MADAIVNDFPAIRRRMLEIQGSNVALPAGIFIITPGEIPVANDLRGCDTVFSLHRDGRVTVYHAYREEILRRRVTEVADWLVQMFPSAQLGSTAIRLSEQDCERLISLLLRMRRRTD